MRTLFFCGVVILSNGCGSPSGWRYGGGGKVDAALCQQPQPLGYGLRCTSAPSIAKVALGVCGDLTADNTLAVDEAPATLSLAVNGRTTTSAPLTVAGNFISYQAIDSRNTEDVSGWLQTAGSLSLSAPVQVGGDAWVGGLNATNSLDVRGTLHTPSGTEMTHVSAGAVSFEAVKVAPALDCGSVMRVSDAVAAAKARPDPLAGNAIPFDALDGIVASTDLTVGCGRYLFNAVEIENNLTLHVHGATTLVVEGDFHIAAPTVIALDPGATLDLVIGGKLALDNTLTVGSPDAPASSWVAVDGDVRIGAPLVLDGALVAPAAAVNADNTFELRGAALVGSLRIAAPMAVHSSAVLASNGCAAP